MKHPVEGRQAIERVLRWLGIASLDPSQWDQIDHLAVWLEEEAIVAGGLGPNESDRIWTRHLCDSLAFARGWIAAGPPPRLLDVGAGVGLPGIPLAILWPETHVTLLDRAGRRTDLARRAVRSLGLDNVDVRFGDGLSEPPHWEAAVFRAVFGPQRALEVGDALLHPTGTAVIGLRGDDTTGSFESTSIADRNTEVVEIPPTVLDGTVSLLIMGPREH